MADEETQYRQTDGGSTAPMNGGTRSADAGWLPPLGFILAGRYKLGDVIGAGGMGAVVRAERLLLGGSVAVKFLHPRLAKEGESNERFLREAMATSRIENEHVVRILDVGTTDDGLPFMVMDLLEGNDLGDVLSHGPLAVTDAVDYILQVCEALAEAHALGIVHRDIKPSNLWLTRRFDGSALVKVLDFGISKLSHADGGDSKLTETSAVFGSPTYMSPEQIRSAKRVDARTDVWSLGVVLHELLTLRQPFEAESVAGVLAAISADAPVALRSVRADAPPELESAILACLEKDLARRATLAQLATLLRPMASAAGAVSAERVARTAPGASMRPPAPSSTHAFAATEPTLSSAKTQSMSVRRSTVRFAPFAVVAVLGLATLAVRLRKPAPSTPGGSTAQPEVSSTQPTAAAAGAPAISTMTAITGTAAASSPGREAR